MRSLAGICILAASTAGALAQETRGLGAHEHGHGTLDIAIAGDRVAVELTAPGADIVGFEHAAETAEHRTAVEDAVAQLARPADLFAFPAEAECRVTEASVELLGGEGHAEHHEGEAHAEGDAHEGDEHAEGEEHGDGEAHSEFRAAYMLDCADIGALTSIEFPYFALFPNAELLAVQIAGPSGATARTVGRDGPTLDLSGMM